MTGAGAPRGLPGERPPTGGGGGQHAVSAGTVLQRDVHTWPGDVVQHRRVPSPAGPRPGLASATAARWSSAPMARPLPVRDPGDAERPSPGTGGTCFRLRRSGKPCRRCRTRLRLPGGSAPCTRARRRWVGARTVVRQSRSAAGSAPSEVSQVAAEIGLQAADVLGDRAVGHGHPGKRATGLGVLRMERRTASSGWLPWSRNSVRSGAGERPSRRRRAGPYGNELRKEPGDLDRRAGTGEPRAG